jgi:hypothetical protein
MGWETQQNRNSLSPHGLKEAGGYIQRIDSSWSRQMPTGLPTAGQKLPPKVFDRHALGAGNRNLTSGTSGDRLRWGANLQPSGRR